MVASAQESEASNTRSCQPTWACWPNPLLHTSTATPTNPSVSPTQVRALTGVARRPYLPSHAIQNAELELISAA
jgi:hypothetical protein